MFPRKIITLFSNINLIKPPFIEKHMTKNVEKPKDTSFIRLELINGIKKIHKKRKIQDAFESCVEELYFSRT
ncbi:hypothetical protein DMK83_26005 [Vibrio parahaemolyticus]|nr:hypothetical protein [Vibrio parahaemolyticus]